MNEFLELNPPERFWELIDRHLNISPPVEEVDYSSALHRILAEDIRSRVNLPPFDRSTVDGFAVRAADTAGASESLPVYLKVKGEVLMGEGVELELKAGEAVKIPTGGMLPSGADAVIMIEHTDYLDENTVETSRAVAAGENVVAQGEDIEKGELLLKKGQRLRPQDIGALAGLGITTVKVYHQPVVAIISTGDELVPPETSPGSGEIRDINSYSISSLLIELGCQTRVVGIIEDNYESLLEAVKGNLDADLVLISGGSSVGVKDMTIDVLNSLGDPGVLLHGISIKPGKPTILAVVGNKPVLGLPGHPTSAWTITNKLVIPLARLLLGEQSGQAVFKQMEVEAYLSRNLASDKGREEYIPVKLEDKDKLIAKPILGKSSLITTLVEADGFLKIDTFQEGLNSGDRVKIELFGRGGR